MNEISEYIAKERAELEEIIEKLYKLNKDLFWLLMQHATTEELTEQAEELQEIRRTMGMN